MERPGEREVKLLKLDFPGEGGSELQYKNMLFFFGTGICTELSGVYAE
jgi:hypothetical protein